jgi:hypothetical protein
MALLSLVAALVYSSEYTIMAVYRYVVDMFILFINTIAVFFYAI